MAVDISGLEDLLLTVDNLGDLGKRLGTSSLRKSMKPGLEIIKNNAPKDTSKGANSLKIGEIKRYKNGGLQGKMGIDASNWEDCKHLWYQHWGYENKGLNIGGKKVTKHVGWFDEATEKAKETVLNQLEKEVTQALDGILK